MAKVRDFTDEEIQNMMANGDIPDSLKNSAEKVVVILTQGWCHQWADMETWIEDYANQANIYRLIYDKRPEFQTIMAFKEHSFKNFEVPYIRYYHKGELILASNWLPKNTFAAMLNRDKPFSLK